MAESLNFSTVEKLVLGVTEKASIKCREFVLAAEDKITLIVGENHIVIAKDGISVNGLYVQLNSGGPPPGIPDDPPGPR